MWGNDISFLLSNQAVFLVWTSARRRVVGLSASVREQRIPVWSFDLALLSKMKLCWQQSQFPGPATCAGSPDPVLRGHWVWFNVLLSLSCNSLRILSLDGCFVSEIQWDSGEYVWAEEIHGLFLRSLSPHSCLAFGMPLDPACMELRGSRRARAKHIALLEGACIKKGNKTAEWVSCGLSTLLIRINYICI